MSCAGGKVSGKSEKSTGSHKSSTLNIKEAYYLSSITNDSLSETKLHRWNLGLWLLRFHRGVRWKSHSDALPVCPRRNTILGLKAYISLTSAEHLSKVLYKKFREIRVYVLNQQGISF